MRAATLLAGSFFVAARSQDGDHVHRFIARVLLSRMSCITSENCATVRRPTRVCSPTMESA